MELIIYVYFLYNLFILLVCGDERDNFDSSSQKFISWSKEDVNVKLHEEWHVVKNWPQYAAKLGQVSGVALDSKGNVYVFHRANHVWNSSTFNNFNHTYAQITSGPIKEPTVLIFNTKGELLKTRCAGMFFMPHGITVDKWNNIWLTDVAMHQIYKLNKSSDSPSMILGEKFVPGTDSQHFCKPTSVAVSSLNGDIFISDGYCNSRILKFNKYGKKIAEWGRNTPGEISVGFVTGLLNIPHKIVIVEDKNWVCVADRENGKMKCFDMYTTDSKMVIKGERYWSRLFSISYSNLNHGIYAVINGPDNVNNPVRGYILNNLGQVTSFFGSNFLENPHDVVIDITSDIYVAEIGPNRISKFTRNISLSKLSLPLKSNFRSPSLMPYSSEDDPLETDADIAGAVVLTSVCLIFGAFIICAVFIFTRNQKRKNDYDSVRLLPSDE